MEQNKEICTLSLEIVHLCQQGTVAVTCAENQAVWPGSVLHLCSYSAVKVSELVVVHSVVLWGLDQLT